MSSRTLETGITETPFLELPIPEQARVLTEEFMQFPHLVEEANVQFIKDPDFGYVVDTSIKNADAREFDGYLAKTRLIYNYLFLRKLFPYVDKILEIGIYDGYPLSIEVTMVRKLIYAIDAQFDNIREASNRPDIQPYVHHRREDIPLIRFKHAHAQHITVNEKFDLAFLIEVLTEFIGKPQDIKKLAQRVHNVLNPNGKLVATLPSLSKHKIASLQTGPPPRKIEKGHIRPYMDDIRPIFDEVFGDNSCIIYGQLPSSYDDFAVHIPIPFRRMDYETGPGAAPVKAEYFLPRRIPNNDLSSNIFGQYTAIWEKKPPLQGIIFPQ